MTEGIKKPLRALFRTAMQFYPREYGKYSILMKLYFPYLAPVPPTKEVVTLHDGIRMELELNEYLQSQLYLFGEFEPATVKVLKRLVKSGDTVLDIGANVGYMSLVLAKCVGKNGKVFSFEPDSKNFASLKRNIELNADCNIEPIAKAVSDSHHPFDCIRRNLISTTVRTQFCQAKNIQTSSWKLKPQRLMTSSNCKSSKK